MNTEPQAPLKATERIRASVRALEKPAPHVFRALYLEASERVFERKADLLKRAAEEKDRSDAAMTRIFMSAEDRPRLSAEKPAFLDQLQLEDKNDANP